MMPCTSWRSREGVRRNRIDFLNSEADVRSSKHKSLGWMREVHYTVIINGAAAGSAS